jgi:hypothetical protein
MAQSGTVSIDAVDLLAFAQQATTWSPQSSYNPLRESIRVGPKVLPYDARSRAPLLAAIWPSTRNAESEPLRRHLAHLRKGQNLHHGLLEVSFATPSFTSNETNSAEPDPKAVGSEMR